MFPTTSSGRGSITVGTRGDRVGRNVGSAVEGSGVGLAVVGVFVGWAVEGAFVGFAVVG